MTADRDDGMAYRIREDCRLCGAGGLEQLLELKPTPPANELLEDRQESLDQERFPLGLWQCRECGHVQLPVVIDPERLFRTYPYVSGTSPVFVDHLRRYAGSVMGRFGMIPGHLVVEVGSNDGTFLKFFQDAGMRVVGVDPARNVREWAVARGVRTIPEFMDLGIAKSIVLGEGKASLVVANNVFAHSDDLVGMAEAVREVLHDFGVFVFEVQYLADLCDKALFDMVYHEHMSYHHVGPLIGFFRRLGMRIFDVEHVDVHGGSIRCYADFGRRPASHRVEEALRRESSIGLIPAPDVPNAVKLLGAKIEEVREALTDRVREIVRQGGRIVGYGAPAKACTLAHHFGLGGSVIDFVVDDNPLKQGRHLPGLGVPIRPPSALLDVPAGRGDHRGDHLLVLAWNYADDIMSKPVCVEFRDGGGRFIVPFPEIREL